MVHRTTSWRNSIQRGSSTTGASRYDVMQAEQQIVKMKAHFVQAHRIRWAVTANRCGESELEAARMNFFSAIDARRCADLRRQASLHSSSRIQSRKAPIRHSLPFSRAAQPLKLAWIIQSALDSMTMKAMMVCWSSRQLRFSGAWAGCRRDVALRIPRGGTFSWAYRREVFEVSQMEILSQVSRPSART